MRSTMQVKDDSVTKGSNGNSSPVLESRISHLFTPLLMTPSLLTPSLETPTEALRRGRQKNLPPMQEMRRRWSNSNEKYLPSVDVADIPRYEFENGLVKSEDPEEE